MWQASLVSSALEGFAGLRYFCGMFGIFSHSGFIYNSGIDPICLSWQKIVRCGTAELSWRLNTLPCHSLCWAAAEECFWLTEMLLRSSQLVTGHSSHLPRKLQPWFWNGKLAISLLHTGQKPPLGGFRLCKSEDGNGKPSNNICVLCKIIKVTPHTWNL